MLVVGRGFNNKKSSLKAAKWQKNKFAKISYIQEGV